MRRQRSRSHEPDEAEVKFFQRSHAALYQERRVREKSHAAWNELRQVCCMIKSLRALSWARFWSGLVSGLFGPNFRCSTSHQQVELMSPKQAKLIDFDFAEMSAKVFILE